MARVSPAQFVRQVRQEVSRISWASRRETGTATLTVFIMVSIAAVFFLLVDMVLSNVCAVRSRSWWLGAKGILRFGISELVGKKL